MTLIEVLFCGFLGGFAADGLELYRIVRANGGCWPNEWKKVGFWIAEFVRIAAGVGIAWVFWRSDQVDGPLGAVVVGATTPLIVEKFSRAVNNHTFDLGLDKTPSEVLSIQKEEVHVKIANSDIAS